VTDIALFAHSWLRWCVLAAGILVLARARRRTWLFFVSLLDTQFLVGLILFIGLRPTGFFARAHPAGMTIALIATHTASVLARRAKGDTARRRRWCIGVGVALLAIIATVPWPWLDYGRPLFRP
jgi:hypothetical protein